MDATQDRELATDVEAINRELELFDPALRRKPQIVAANKIDIPEARERAQSLRKKLKRRKIDAHLVSGATGEGLDELLDATMRVVDSAPLPAPLERDAHPMVPANGAPIAAAMEDERELDSRARVARAPAKVRRSRGRRT